jgi:DNA invertase Pin-like site-specific DNA recombinase
MSSKRAIIYIRTAMPPDRPLADGKTSAQLQYKFCLEFCTKHNIPVVDSLFEVADGGEVEQRPAFDKLLRMLRNGDADTVVALNIARLSKHAAVVQAFFDEMVPRGIEVISVIESQPSTENTGMIAGVAAIIEEVMHGRYLAGLHRDHA